MQIFTFSNGFRIIHEKPNSDISIASILGFVKLGSIYETDDNRGVSHFIEHMCFKGTSRRPKSKMIINHYDKIGADINAYTEKGYTCYEIKCHEEDLANSILILSDMLLNSSFDKAEFMKEYQVILEETIKRQDEFEIIIQDNAEFAIYEGSSYQYPVDSLSYHKKPKFKYENVIKTYHDYYRPDNMVLSIISHISFQKLKTILKTTSFMKNVRQVGIYSQPINSLKFQSEIKYNIKRNSHISTLYLCVSFRTCQDQSNDRYVLDLLRDIIGSAFSSRLFTILREDNGLTYSSNSSTNYYSHSGDFTIFAILDSQKLLKNGGKKGVFPLIIDLLNDLYMEGVTKEEIKTFKGYVKGQSQIDMEDSYNKCEYNGKNLLLYGENFTPFEKVFEKHYVPITKNDIDSAIKKYFKKANMTVCLLGNNIPSLEIIKRHTERFLG
jgi:predicted Zn-dependent peptidase